jgi:hypothetical protein
LPQTRLFSANQRRRAGCYLVENPLRPLPALGQLIFADGDVIDRANGQICPVARTIAKKGPWGYAEGALAVLKPQASENKGKFRS